MTIFGAYKQGFLHLFRLKKMWLLLYFLNLAFAFVIAMPLNSLLKISIGRSLLLETGSTDFDYTLVSDFLNHFGHAFYGLINQSYFVIFVFLIFSVFLTGGILHLISREKKFEFSSFFKGAGQYFWRLLFLMLIILIIHLFVCFLFFQIFSSGGLNPLQMENDAALLQKLMWVLPIYMLFAYVIYMIHDFIKVEIVQHHSSLFRAIGVAIKKVVKSFPRYFGLYLLNLIVSIVLIAFFVWLRQTVGLEIFWAAFIVSQLFILVRIALRVIRLGSAYSISD